VTGAIDLRALTSNSDDGDGRLGSDRPAFSQRAESLVSAAVDRLPRVRQIAQGLADVEDVGRRAVRVVITDAQALVRAGYRALLEADDRITVTGEAASLTEALAVSEDAAADVVLLDLGLPDFDDLEAATEIISCLGFAGVAIILIHSGEHADRVYTAIRAGAMGALAKDVQPHRLTRAVLAVAHGDALLSAQAVGRLLSELPPQWPGPRPVSSELDELTDREREVVALVASGLSTPEIAERLVISRATAKTHVNRAMLKLHAHHRSQLVVLAYETGLVQPRRSLVRPGGALALA
jgi:DNA-binding NarL/FixJ family response regulator